MSPPLPEPPKLYQHTCRRDWGLAVITGVRGTSRLFHFGDGETREFPESSTLMRPVARRACARELIDDLESQVEALHRRRSQARIQRTVSCIATKAVAPRVQSLLREYPNGFRGTRWAVRVRGHGATRRLKRHRAPAILGARQRLDASVLRPLLGAAKYQTIHRLAVETLESTDLVHMARVRSFATLRGAEQRQIATALVELLHGEGSFDRRFDSFVKACDTHDRRPPSWELVTAHAALMFPDTHVCVQPGTLAAHARDLGLVLDLPERPSAVAYRHAVGLVQGTRDACAAHGLAPRDLLDVYDFIRVSCPEN